VSYSWDFFTKRLHVEKHIGIMNENPGGGHDPHTSFCRRPMTTQT